MWPPPAIAVRYDFCQPHRLGEALGCGAAGIQVGTAFAFCEESGIDTDLKARVLDSSRRREIDTFTDPIASPTGFPFNVVRMAGTISEPPVYAAQQRVCDLGYLRRAYRKVDETLGYRCPGEPEELFVSKGGRLAETQGRRCVCNGLLSTIDLGQIQPGGYREPALLAAGDDVKELARFLPAEQETCSAADVIRHLLP